jgi:hypothetical protein
MREVRNEYNRSVGKPEYKYHFGDLGLDKKIILKWVRSSV